MLYINLFDYSADMMNKREASLVLYLSLHLKCQQNFTFLIVYFLKLKPCQYEYIVLK